MVSSRLLKGPFRLGHVSRSPQSHEVRAAVDGSICVVTVQDCVPDAEFPVDICSLCHEEKKAHENKIIGKNSCFSLCLGQLPDLAPTSGGGGNPCTHLNGRSLIEQILTDCKPRELIKVTFECSFVSGDNVSVNMAFYVNEVRYPPVCTPSTSVPLEIARKSGALDPLDNLTSDWNPELAVCWAYRAWKLKNRGTWLVNKHLDKSKSGSDTKHQSKSGQPDEETIRLWSCAFSCYSRALQLARLAKWARQTCGTLNLSAGDCHSDTLKSPWFSKPLHTREVDPSISDAKHNGDKESHQHSANCLDLDYPQNFDSEGSFSLSASSLERLEFSLLLNLALCQLKVGSMELAAENCSHALLFDPGWMKFAKQREEMGDSGSALNDPEGDKWEFTNLDIAKALYRRAQAYSSIANWDDAESDLKMVIHLQKYPNKDGLPSGGGSLAASEALLKQVRTNTSRDSAVLAERLRRHRSEL